jgi:hypothetical protein
MSPSESQLRAALREGEGERLDAGLLIANANRARRERRRRINQLAGATLVVGVVGVGFTALARGGSDDQGGGSSSSGGRAAALRSSAPAAGGVAGGVGGGGQSAHQPAKSAVPAPGGNYAPARSCPSVPTHIALPAGVTQDEASGPLLPTDAAAIRACGYPSGAQGGSVVLQATRASALAATINSAPTRPGRTLRTCAKDERTGTVELLAVDGTGRPVRPVVVTIACPQAVATNGMATRYFTVAPALLRNLLR